MAEGYILNANDEKPMSGLLSSAPRRAILLGVETPESDWPIEESLDELEQLASTGGVNCVDRVIQRLAHPHPATMLGTGKVLVSDRTTGLYVLDTRAVSSQPAVFSLIFNPNPVATSTSTTTGWTSVATVRT